MHYIKGNNRHQTALFPESLEDYISEENPVRFIDAFVEKLDLEGLNFSQSRLNRTGRPPYHPSILLKLYIYGYVNRVRSSRRLESECHRNVELMWLLEQLKPDHKTISEFRREHVDALKGVCREFTLLCKQLDLFGAQFISIDGSKFAAVNSSKKNYSRKGLEKLLVAIDKNILNYFELLEAGDTNEKGVKDYSKSALSSKIAPGVKCCGR